MNDSRHEYWMQQAIDLARKGMSANAGGPFGAIVVKDNQVVGRGHNSVTSTNDPTAHAEVVAIREACHKLGTFQLDGCVLYTSCEPCPMCLGAIYWARPEKVYYACSRLDAAEAGFDDELIYREINLEPAERKIPFEQIRTHAALEVFKDWINKPDKTPY